MSRRGRFAWFTGKPSIYVPCNAVEHGDGFAAWMQHFRPTHLAVPRATARELGFGAVAPLATATATDWVLVATGLRARPFIPDSSRWRAPDR